MGSKEEDDQISTPTLQLLCNTNTLSLTHSPPRSGAITPPLYGASAAVPFRWEEEPGKPRKSTSFSALSIPKCLDLPPRLFNSPTTVLEGPYRRRFQSSSFRIVRKESYGSFRRSFSPERGQMGALVVSGKLKDRSILGSWRWGRKGFRGKREVTGGSYVFPNSAIDKDVEEKEDEEMSCRDNVKITRVRQSGSFSKSRFWATVYGSLKQAVPWKSRKFKKDGLVM